MTSGPAASRRASHSDLSRPRWAFRNRGKYATAVGESRDVGRSTSARPGRGDPRIAIAHRRRCVGPARNCCPRSVIA